MTLDKYIQRYLDKATTEAEKGNADSMNISLKLARERAREKGVSLYEESESGSLYDIIDSIEQKCYMRAVEVELDTAKKLAKAGDASSMEICLERSEKFNWFVRPELKKDISRKVYEIGAMGYRASVPMVLDTAKKLAKAGDASSMESYLKIAEEYARKVILYISDKVDEIKKIGYRESIPVQLDYARERALAGNASSMVIHLRTAEGYASKIGQDISDKVDEIKEICYRASLPETLDTAEKLAKVGDAYLTELCLKKAQGYASKIGQDISDEVCKIRALLPYR